MNYDTLQNEILADKESKGKTLLLHACCAPCSTYCLKKLCSVFDVTLFYSNDNVFPKEEYEKRLFELKKLIELINGNKCEITSAFSLKFVVKEYEHENYLNCVKNYEDCQEGGERCFRCYGLRLSSAFSYAEKNSFDYFCTTLSVSPYKNAEKLNEIGLSLQSVKTKWLVSDFKKCGGYQYTIDFCKQHGIYRQSYCGCPFENSASVENK